MDEMRKSLSKKQRIVVKVGSSTITHEATGNINFAKLEKLVRLLTDLHNQGKEVVLVTSGAVAVGRKSVGMLERPKTLSEKQACAAIGQCELMYTYDKLFQEYNHTVAQMLMTGADFENEERHTNFDNTLNRLLEFGVLPIVNENDTIATSEIKVGDNDTLSAIVATSAKADMLILLSDIDGLYTADPHKVSDASLIPVVTEINDEIRNLAGTAGTSRGTGGMVTKLHAAEICMNAGIDMVIANGSNPDVLYDIFDGKSVGTRFTGKEN